MFNLIDTTKLPLYKKGMELKDNEFLFTLSNEFGAMCTLNKDKTLRAGLESYLNNYSLFVIEEKFRIGWRLINTLEGSSTPYFNFIHPLGFKLTLSGKIFNKIINKITIINGEIQEPLYYTGAYKKDTQLLVGNK